MGDPRFMGLLVLAVVALVALAATAAVSFKQALLIKAQSRAITAQRDLIAALEVERDAHKINAAAQTEYAEMMEALAASRLERLKILEGTTHG